MTNKFLSISIVLVLGWGSSALAQDHLVAYYTFEGNFSDSSGNNLNGTPFGDATIVFDTDRESNVLRLDGEGDYVDLGNDTLFNWTGAFSAAFWIKVNAWQGSWDTVLKKSDVWSFERDIERNALAFYHWPNFVPTVVTVLEDGNWHHIAATYDGVEQKIYKDGMLMGTKKNIGDMNINTNHVFIGSDNGGGRYFNGWLDDVRIYNRVLSDAEIDSLGRTDTTGEPGPGTKIVGNYELNIEVVEGDKSGPIKVFFSANRDTSIYAFIEIFGDEFKVGRELLGKRSIWKTFQGVGSPPWSIRILKKGNFYRFWVNNATGWMRGPLGEWEGLFEPWEAYVGTEVPKAEMVQSFSVTTLPWLQQITQPVIQRGPAGSFYEAQVIPGGIIKYHGIYYMYFLAGKFGTQEGSLGRQIGVASSSDLRNWTVHPEPVVRLGQLSFPHDNLYPSGAVITPEGKIAVMFAVQNFPNWVGFCLATADHPLGPFESYEGNPVYNFAQPHHEFDLVRVDDPNYRYILFFAGFTTNPPSGPVGDRGYLLYSNDLINWTEDPRNPVFGPETLNDWDAVHVRPRSLTKIEDMWYLWYEGANTWTPPTSNYPGWWDTIGLARSQDLINWKYYPRNPALPGLGISQNQFDAAWVGWPRMWVENDTGYVFFTGGAETGLRTIAIDQLTNWESEGGQVTGVGDAYGETPADNSALAKEFILNQNYPNPFNPNTYITFRLLVANEVTLSIYNPVGQQIYSHKQKYEQPGTYRFTWMGIDRNGNRVASGIYFYELKIKNRRAVKKMLLIR
ncbi:MAG: LamG-like jellyroll fold domain-containing protein [bacterium]